MTQPDCSSSWIKNRLKEELIELSELLRHHIEQLPEENVCLMKQFESMRTKMTHLVTTAASYYLNCYLSPYTAKYEAISTSVQHLCNRFITSATDNWQPSIRLQPTDCSR
ncbi:YojJ domain-containing protein [Paenibacillus sp. GYB004]|uniref:diadenylate cyclase domain-containing protein n=1 Tax=Paenibacillus sp. GYB004 TaxID=2994393 RepID=UPI002F966699